MNKASLRKLYLEKRKTLTRSELVELSESVFNRFTTLSFPSCKLLLSYSPIPHHQEFDVKLCEDHLRERHDHLVVGYPRLLQEDYQMEAIEPGTEELTSKNRYGIIEPANGRIIAPHEIDLVFVPLVAFDANGFRVGYGKGYYDRFLKKCRKDCLTIGFSFFEVSPSADDIDQFDVPLRFCISPLRVYEF